MTPKGGLAAVCERSGFGPMLGARPRTLPVFTGIHAPIAGPAVVTRFTTDITVVGCLVLQAVKPSHRTDL